MKLPLLKSFHVIKNNTFNLIKVSYKTKLFCSYKTSLFYFFKCDTMLITYSLRKIYFDLITYWEKLNQIQISEW